MRRALSCGMLRGVSKGGHLQREGGCAVVRHRHHIAIVAAFLLGCAVLLFLGCAAGRSEAPEEQGHTEATKEQARSPEGTASEEAQCEGTRTFQMKGGGGPFTTV